MKKNIKIVIEYLGANYCGFQKQKNGVSIQQKIEEAIYLALGEKVTIYPSGRTDAGVNAYNQVANFFTETNIPVEKLNIIINFHLPKDIRIKTAEEVPFDFHSRKSAVSKTYIYKMFLGENLSVFDENRVTLVKQKLDFDLLNKASKLVEGEHDFSAFVASKASTKTTIRTIFSSKFIWEGDYLTYKITGNGFLYNMVRILVGTLLEVAQRKKTIKDFENLLNGGERKNAGKTLSPSGLYLLEVMY